MQPHHLFSIPLFLSLTLAIPHPRPQSVYNVNSGNTVTNNIVTNTDTTTTNTNNNVITSSSTSSNPTTSSSIPQSSFSISTTTTSASSTNSNGLTTFSNTNTTFISVRGTNGPFLALDPFSPFTTLPLAPATQLLQNLAYSLPKNNSGFASPLKASSGNLSLVLEGTALGNDFIFDALAGLSEYFGNRVGQAFETGIRIVNLRTTPAGQESVKGNLTMGAFSTS